MMRRLGLCAGMGLMLLGMAACDASALPGAEEKPAAKPAPAPPASSKPLYPPAAASPAPSATSPRGRVADPIVLPDCRLTVVEKEDVPGQQDGFLVFIGTDIKPGEVVPPDRLLTVKIGNQERKIRRLKEDDVVEAGQLLAQLDDRLTRDDLAIRNARVAAGKADLAAAEKTRDEAEKRYQTQLRLQAGGQQISSEEDVRAAKLLWEKTYYEAISKKEALALATLEANQSQTALQMCEIRSHIPGVIKTIYKNPGEFVKRAEPVFQIHNLSRLRVEGLVEVEHLPRLRTGMRVVVEPSRATGPDQTFHGHLQEITGVAVSKDTAHPLIVSASEDGTARVWDRDSRHERRVLRHPAPVRCVACAPPGSTTAPSNLCLTGAADGVARLWELEKPAGEPIRELKDGHQGAVTCVAFSPDGKSCATGGADHQIVLWDTARGTMRYRFPEGHHGTVTALQFTPHSQLVSAGRDDTVRLWTLGDQDARLTNTLDRRSCTATPSGGASVARWSGDVTQLGVSPDGTKVFMDQDKGLLMLRLADGMTEAILSAAAGSNFTTCALFSPDSRLILTGCGPESRLQLWRTPTETLRGHPVRQLVAADRSPATCAAFAPDGSFVVSGTRDRQVLVWPVPGREELDRPLMAEVTRLERAVESNARQVRIWAELPNLDYQLLPGTTVTLAIYPGE
jgi:WD40 repeat protein/multidrug efflux pump subunit AcrA (membrane-fusion protein)